MKCSEVEKYLPLYPGDIDIVTKGKIEKHLSGCEKCRKTLESLKIYSSFVSSSGTEEVPDNFESKVIQKLRGDVLHAKRRNPIIKWGITAASAAALLIVFLLFGPGGIQKEDIIEANFALRSEKKGKGPEDAVDIGKINSSINRIIEETGSEIKESEKNIATDYYDYVLIGVPNSQVENFVDKFNKASIIPVKLPGRNISTGEQTYFKIYFDMINFTPGNFDGDKRADLLIQFVSGKNKGKWVLFKNDKDSYYVNNYDVTMGNDELRYIGDFDLISGDFNGDGYDDICLYEFSKYRGLTTFILLNNKNLSFREAPADFFKMSIPNKGEFRQLMTGDADGDGDDDLLWLGKYGGDQYGITAINIHKTYQKLELPDADSCAGNIIAGDLNGDSYFDIVIKYIDKNRAGDTEIFFNKKNSAFRTVFRIGRKSFAGDYLFFPGDCNGDGLDDVYVKEGGPFMSGMWYVMISNTNEYFKGGKGFELMYNL